MLDDKSISRLEKLHKLKTDGVITDADFEKAKEKLLEAPVRRAATVTTLNTNPFQEPFDGTMPADSDGLGWMLLPLRRYADFTGRSCRREFWMFGLVFFALFLVSAIFAGIALNFGIGVFLLGVLGLFIPQLAVQVRRFHDQDKSGWFALFNFIPYIGWLIVLIFMLIEGTHGENQYGPDPLGRD